MTKNKCNHERRYLDSSKVNNIPIIKFKCTVCNKLYIVHQETGVKVTFNGGLGEEIEDDRR